MHFGLVEFFLDPGIGLAADRTGPLHLGEFAASAADCA